MAETSKAEPLKDVMASESLPRSQELVEKALLEFLEARATAFGSFGAGKYARVLALLMGNARAWASPSLEPSARAVEERAKHPAESLPSTTTEAKIRELQEQLEKFRVENQLLQSRVAEERRTAGRETQRYDQLQVQNDKLLDCLKDRDKAIDATIALLLERSNARLRMIERYEGVVEHVHGDSVAVVFEIDDDVVEHTYRRNQLIGGQLPEAGERITVYVHVVQGSAEQEDDAAKGAEELDEHQEYTRKRITGPIEF